jgi:hypothetical protein
MSDLSQQIKDLETKINGLVNLLDITTQEIERLEQENHLDKNQIRNKEQELED